jgi:hypothetical protein
MRPSHALGLALRDFYRNSWRLLPFNAAVGAVLVVAGIGAVAVRAALLIALLAGPLLAALTHSTVTLVRTGNVTIADGLEGLRLHWRRGLALGAAGGALLYLGATAIHVYGSTPLWPLSFVTIYLLVLFGIYQLVLWTFAIADPGASLRAAATEAAQFIAARPRRTLALGLLLLLVNAGGIAAGLMPFLTLTVAFSFLAAAHFVLEVD